MLKQTKGFKWGRKSKFRLAKQATQKALTYSFRDRKKKKSAMRGLQQVKINVMCRENGVSYSKFIALLKKNKIELNRKVLAEIAQEYPDVFKKIVEQVKS